MKYACFLRGVNVAGNTRVDMKLLKERLEDSEVKNVSSYLNSGNIILDSELDKEELNIKIDKLIKDNFGIDIVLFILDFSELNRIALNLPFSDTENEKSKQLAYILSKPVKKEDIEKIKNVEKIVESIYLEGDILYIYYLNGIGKSKLTTGYIEKVLNVNTTGRNLNTIQRLLDKGNG